MASFGDQYNYQVAFSPAGEAQTVAAVQKVSRATKQAADDAKAASKAKAQAAREAAAEEKRAAKELEQAQAKAAQAAQRLIAETRARVAAAHAATVAAEREAAATRAQEAADRAAAAAAAQQAAAARNQERAFIDLTDAEQHATLVGARMGRAMGDVGAAGQRAGATISQFAYILDDAAYGARGLRNQVLPLSTALLGFGPAGAAVGAAGTILVGVFGEQIDKALAYAGVLDENLVKGMEHAGEQTEVLAEKVNVLEGALDQNAATADRWVAALKGVAEQVGYDEVAAGLDELARSVAPPISGMEELRAKVEELDAQADELEKRGGLMGPAAAKRNEAQVRIMRAEAERLRGEIDKLAEAYEGRVQGAAERFRAGLEAGGEQAQAVIDQLDKIPGAAEGAFWPLRQALFETTDEFKQAEAEAEVFAFKLQKAAEETEKNEKAAKELGKAWLEDAAEALRKYGERLAEVNKAEAEWEAQRRQRRAERERASLDETTRRVVEAAGSDPRIAAQIGQTLQGGVAMGMSPDRAGQAAMMQVFNILRQAGVGTEAATGAAQQLVGEQQTQVQAYVDANNLRHQLDRQMLGNFDMMIQALDRNRGMSIEGLRRAEMQQRRIAQFQRRFAPMRLRQGNNLRGGW